MRNSSAVNTFLESAKIQLLMNYTNIIDLIKSELQKRWQKEPTGHDFYHLQRVVNLSNYIAQKEKFNPPHLEITAWLHDSFDRKIIENEDREKMYWSAFLAQEGLTENAILEIFKAIDEVSFSQNKGKVPNTMVSKIIQDADRLDALGAIGIARTFAYGGKKNRLIFDEFNPPSPPHYSEPTHSECTIAHFYEKLLLLKEGMHTETAKALAEQRHQFLEQFLSQFYKEWEFGKK